MLHINVETATRKVSGIVSLLGTCLTLDAAEETLRTHLSRNTDLIVYRGGNHVAVCVDGANRLILITEVPDTLANLKAMVSTIREAAKHEAHKACGTVRGVFQSRGTYLTVETSTDSTLNRADCWEWDGTRKGIREAWHRYGYHNATTMTICGGYDYAESPAAMQDGDYDPWVSEWDVAIPPALFRE